MRVDVYLNEADLAESLRHDVRQGLAAEPKWLPPKWFYDAHGSDLFEQITRLPEYYPTEAERGILRTHAAPIAEITGAKTVIELGSGSSDKTRLLLDALHLHGTLARFVPLDVSESALRSAAAALHADYPGVEVHAIVGDFTAHLDRVPAGDARLVVFLGGTIGNLTPTERHQFLTRLRASLNHGDHLLLGTDLVKDERTLVAAYDDSAGVTAEFNRNVLRVINRELDADFEVDSFTHVARWNREQEWIEMRLRARRAMTVRVAGIGLDVSFAEGEEMRTEISAKFRRDRVEAELGAAGFRLTQWWTDAAGRFALSLAGAADTIDAHEYSG